MENLRTYERFFGGRKNKVVEPLETPGTSEERFYSDQIVRRPGGEVILERMKVTREDINILRKYFQHITPLDKGDYLKLILSRRAGNYDITTDYMAYFIPENDYIVGIYDDIDDDDFVTFHRKKFDNPKDAIEWLCYNADEINIEEKRKKLERENLRKTDELDEPYKVSSSEHDEPHKASSGSPDIHRPRQVAGRYYSDSMPQKKGRNIEESKKYKLKHIIEFKNKF